MRTGGANRLASHATIATRRASLLECIQSVSFSSNGVRLMSWAKSAIDKLRQGETVQIRPRGHSMRGKINSGELVTIEPCDPNALAVGNIVLVTVNGRDYLHLIKAISKDRFLIGNNRGGTNGWVGAGSIHGIATKVEL